MAGLHVARSGVAHAHPAALLEVLGGRSGQHVLGAVADLAGAAGVPDAGEGAVEPLEQRWHPGTAGLGHDELEAGEALEDAREHELHERALGVEAHLVDVEQHRGGVGPVVGVAGAAVHVHRDLEILDHLPQAVVHRVVERLDPLHVGRQVREQDAAPQAVLLDPLHVGDGVVDVVEEDLADAGPPLGELAAPVLQPAVVGVHPGMAVGVLLIGRRLGEQHEAREERWDRVGEHHLGGDAVGLLLGVAHLVVPVAQPPRVPEVLVRVLVLVPPGVEVLEVGGIEVLPIGGVRAAGVAVRRDDRVPVVDLGGGHRAPPPADRSGPSPISLQ